MAYTAVHEHGPDDRHHFSIGHGPLVEGKSHNDQAVLAAAGGARERQGGGVEGAGVHPAAAADARVHRDGHAGELAQVPQARCGRARAAPAFYPRPGVAVRRAVLGPAVPPIHFKTCLSP